MQKLFTYSYISFSVFQKWKYENKVYLLIRLWVTRPILTKGKEPPNNYKFDLNSWYPENMK